jgi:hypothetical protein
MDSKNIYSARSKVSVKFLPGILANLRRQPATLHAALGPIEALRKG